MNDRLWRFLARGLSVVALLIVPVGRVDITASSRTEVVGSTDAQCDEFTCRHRENDICIIMESTFYNYCDLQYCPLILPDAQAPKPKQTN
jgi:hypothetical protein